MAITTSYLMHVKNLEEILDSIRHAQAPERFTNKFMQDLGYASTNDRATIGVLKGLGFLDDNGAPTQRYYDYLDEGLSARVLAQGIREAYEDLFRVNKKAHEMSQVAVKRKLKTLLQGSKKDAVLTKMASTFAALCKLADFSTPSYETQAEVPAEEVATTEEAGAPRPPKIAPVLPDVSERAVNLGYTINIELPATRDQQVYDAIFRALREHIL